MKLRAPKQKLRLPSFAPPFGQHPLALCTSFGIQTIRWSRGNTSRSSKTRVDALKKKSQQTAARAGNGRAAANLSPGGHSFTTLLLPEASAPFFCTSVWTASTGTLHELRNTNHQMVPRKYLSVIEDTCRCTEKEVPSIPTLGQCRVKTAGASRRPRRERTTRQVAAVAVSTARPC